MFKRLAGTFRSSSRNTSRRPAKDARLVFHSLEERRLLATLVVNSALDNVTSGDGLVTLREAIVAANNDTVTDLGLSGFGADTIQFATNVFDTPKSIQITSQFELTDELTIEGPGQHLLTIDANASSRIFNITATTGDFTFAGLTLTGGRTIVGSTLGEGGAIRSLTDGNLAIIQTTVSGNSTAGNSAYGGGIFSSGVVTLTNSTVTENSTSGNSADGGGIRSDGAVTLTNSTVRGNSTAGSQGRGGGIWSLDAVTLTSSTVSGNRTIGSSADGGGIWSVDPVMLTSSTVSGNSTEGQFSGGGGIWSLDAVTLTNSTVSGNSAALDIGGGILSKAVTLTSSTVTDNHANSSNATGGGIFCGNGTITVTHSILAGNTAGGGSPDINPNNGIFAVEYSLLGTAVAPDAGGSGNLFNDSPLLSPLQVNGGPTETHALLAGSPAIDAGSPTYNVVDIPNDQRGAPFLRGTGLRVDMGAYERQTVAGLNLVVDTIVDENDGDTSEGDLSLREAIALANGSIGTDTLTFDAAVFDTPQTILLSLGEIDIREAVTIDGPGQHFLTIDAQQQSRIFNIVATTGNFTLAGLTLTGGQTLARDESGGAIRSLTGGNLTIDQSTVSGNSTTGDNASGGGIRSKGAITITSSAISGNSTGGNFAYGGGIYSQGAVTLTDSTVSGNSTAGFAAHGGGIRSLGTVTLTNSTVSGNSTAGYSADGGGTNSKGAVTLIHSTITDNHANHTNAFGGGIWNDNDSIVIDHSIVAGNTAGGGMNDIRPGGGTLDANFSLIQQTGLTITGNDNIIGQSANLAPLANNGGSTETHVLLAGSPAIDAGDPSIHFDPAEFDQRGSPFARVADGGVVGIRIDMGAYERQILDPSFFIVTTMDSELDYSNADVSLREAINSANGNIGADTILFDAALSGSTIILRGTELEITEALTIDATALAQNVTIDANNASRIFHITATSGDFTLAGLKLTGGRTTGDNAVLNDSTFSGGAVRSLTTGSLTLDQSTVSGNSTTGNFANGGGIFASGTGVAVMLTSSTVSDNSSGGGGGGITISGDATLTLTGSTVSGNSSVGSGGGIFTGSGDVTLTGSTVSGNSSARGGGIDTVSGDVTLSSSTVTGNSAAGVGGGVYVFNFFFDPVLLIENSIVAGNTDNGTAADLKPDSTGTLTVNHSLIGDTTGSSITAGTGTGNILNQPALLGPLANNGGPTETHALLPGSPAIDAGSNALAVDAGGNPLLTDQRGDGFGRLIDGDNNGTATVDIGAFEFVEFLLGDVDQNGVVNFLDIDPFIGVLSSGGYQAKADIDLNGTVNFLDINPFIDVLSSGGSSQMSMAQFSAAPAEPFESSRQESDGISVQLIAAPSSPSLPPNDVVSTQLSAAPSEPLLPSSDVPSTQLSEAPDEPSQLAFVGSSQMQNGGDSYSFRNDIPVWNSESAVLQLSHRKADRLAQQDSSSDSGSQAFSPLDASPEPIFATSSADLFDTHPELLDELLDFELDEMFEGLLI